MQGRHLPHKAGLPSDSSPFSHAFQECQHSRYVNRAAESHHGGAVYDFLNQEVVEGQVGDSGSNAYLPLSLLRPHRFHTTPCSSVRTSKDYIAAPRTASMMERRRVRNMSQLLGMPLVWPIPEMRGEGNGVAVWL